jgi:serine O-acetyltransferase
MGVVIGETAVIGNDVHIYHGVTFGGKTLESVKRHPTVGNKVTIGAGATLIGNITIHDGASIGANTTVTHDVAAGAVVVGQASRTL